jgi:phosphoribosyl-AMP cyclohydrolase
MNPWLEAVQWDGEGLAPAVTQDAASGRVLMLAWMNREALAESVRRGEAVYWSRSRQRLWHKGEESGHAQRIVELRLDCDGDAILLRVDQAEGIACHTGRERCFFRKFEDGAWVTTDPVIKDPSAIYGRTT